MKRPITIMTGQFGDLGLSEVAEMMSEIGYEGLELAGAHLDLHKAAENEEYVKEVKSILEKFGLNCWAIAAHLPGQCVGDNWDKRLDNFAPANIAGKPDEIRAWAVEEMKTAAKAAKKMGVKVITGFMGSPIWAAWYSFPQTSPEMIESAYMKIKELWTPIFDVFDECGIKFALEVHPTEIAFDYYSAKKLLEVFDFRNTLGFNFDPSHLVWQGVDPCVFLKDFSDRIYHVHMKDVKVTLDGRSGILGSHIEFGDTRRGWNFVSLGHGDVDFDGIIRELNQMNYCGPLSVEWEDSGMEREFGASEAFEFVKTMNFSPSLFAFDSALKSKEGK